MHNVANPPLMNKRVWNAKRKKWVDPFSQQGYVQPAVREFFPDLKNATNNDSEFKSAKSFVSRCLTKFENGQFNIEGNDGANRYRLLGAGPPRKAVELRESLFDFFIDIRYSLKGRLSVYLLKLKAEELYATYRQLKQEAREVPEDIVICTMD